MNRIYQLAGTIALIASTSAQAEIPAAALYKNELQRCVVALRDQVSDAQTRVLRHYVSGIARRGSWYEFDIRSEAFDDAAAAPVRERHSVCRAHRWQADTQLRATS